ASVFGQLRADGKHFLMATAPPLAIAVALVWAGRAWLRPARSRLGSIARSLWPAALVAVFLIPCSYRRVQASTPDVIYFHALGGLAKSLAAGRTEAQVRPGLRTPPPMPKVTPRPAVPGRNVVLVVTESVRFDAHCSA